MLNAADVSDIIATAVKRHNNAHDRSIETISKSLQFCRHKEFHSRFYQLEEDSINIEKDATGKYTKITFLRKRRETTESPWKEIKLEFKTSPEWNAKLIMKFFIENEPQHPEHDDSFSEVFQILFIDEIKKAFGVEEVGSVSD